MFKSTKSCISGFLTLLLSASLIMLSLHTHGLVDSHGHGDKQTPQEIVKNHLLCPICHAVNEGSPETAESPSIHHGDASESFNDSSQQLLNRPFNYTSSRAPPFSG